MWTGRSAPRPSDAPRRRFGACGIWARDVRTSARGSTRAKLGGVRLELTHRGSYAIRAVLTLARAEKDEVVPARRIAKEMDIPVRFLPQVLGDLSRAGIVEARLGRAGGYRLSKPAAAHQPARHHRGQPRVTPVVRPACSRASPATAPIRVTCTTCSTRRRRPSCSGSTASSVADVVAGQQQGASRAGGTGSQAERSGAVALDSGRRDAGIRARSWSPACAWPRRPLPVRVAAGSAWRGSSRRSS